IPPPFCVPRDQRTSALPPPVLPACHPAAVAAVRWFRELRRPDHARHESASRVLSCEPEPFVPMNRLPPQRTASPPPPRLRLFGPDHHVHRPDAADARERATSPPGTTGWSPPFRGLPA